jgi:hypothetical protein
MTLFIQIVEILFMVTLMFVAIWGFILLKGIFSQLRYKNYLMEKLNQNIYLLNYKKKEE